MIVFNVDVWFNEIRIKFYIVNKNKEFLFNVNNYLILFYMNVIL